MPTTTLCHAILLNVFFKLITDVDSNLFTKTGCKLSENATTLNSVRPISLCAMLCHSDKECSLFQYNERTETCKTSEWFVLNVHDCDPVKDTDDPAFVKDMCPLGFSLAINGSCYMYSGSTIKARHDLANQECENLGGYLVSINTNEELNTLAEYVAAQEGYDPSRMNKFWTGGYLQQVSPEVWKWKDGSDIELDNWYPGEPNNLATQMCAAAFMGGEYPALHRNDWGSTSCWLELSYVCEFKP